MKQGVTFEELRTRVEHEALNRQDYYVPTGEMHLTTDQSGSRLATPCGQFAVKETAHLHLAELCGIDRRYYQRMRTEDPFLLDRNVNHWLTTNAPKQRIVRALKNDSSTEARAIVSSRYAMLDNDALLRTLDPVIDDLGLKVESCDVSEERLIIKMVSPKLNGAVKVGDYVQAGLVVRNSEVRCSAVEVDWFVKRLVCTNGMVVTGPKGQGTSRRHVGRDWDASRRKINYSHHLPAGLVPANTAREEWERQIWSQLQTSLRENLNTSAFAKLLGRLVLTTTMQTRLEPDEIAQRVGTTFQLAPGEQSLMLHHLVRDSNSGFGSGRGGEFTLWDVLNAVTRTAQDVKEYERATALEEMGGQLAHYSPGQWNRLITLN